MGNAPERPEKQAKQKNRSNDQKRKRKKSKNRHSPAGGQQATAVREEFQVVVPKIHEPVPVCVLCGKPIDAISQAIGGPQSGTFSHFDCVLRKIADDEHILSTQKVSYIGRGVFAVIEMHEDNKFTIVKRIPYEDPETFNSMKRYVEGRKR